MLHETRKSGPAKGSSRRGFGRLRKLPSKRWQAAYTGPDGVLYKASVTFEDEDAARGWLKGEQKLIDLDEWTAPAERGQKRRAKVETFTVFSDRWLAGRIVKGQPLKPRTKAHYRKLLDNHLQPEFGPLRVSAITREHVETWYSAQGDATPTLTAHTYSLLRTILASAVDAGMIAANPCHIRGAGNTKRAHKVEPLSIAELAVLVENMPAKYRLLCLLAAWCALRFGELAELRRKDVDLTNGVLKIRRGVVRVDGKVLVGTPKSDAGARNVAIPPHLVGPLRTHLAEHAEAGRDGLVFPAAGGGQLAPSTLYGKAPTRVKTDQGVEWRGGTNFYRARAIAGHPQLHFHDLRHTGAVLAAQTGATLAELMNRLGHSTPGAAMRYQHAAADRDKAIAAALSKMVEG